MDNTTLFFTIFNLSGKFEFVDKLMVFGAEYVIFLTAALVLLFTLKGTKREKKAFLLIIFGFPLAIILIKIIHLFYNVPRPFISFPITPLIAPQDGSTFPSRHTTAMAVTVFAYGFYKSKWTFFMVALLFWVGISRIFVGVHYPLDILGGIITGFISIFLTWQFKNWLKNKLS